MFVLFFQTLVIIQFNGGFKIPQEIPSSVHLQCDLLIFKVKSSIFVMGQYFEGYSLQGFQGLNQQFKKKVSVEHRPTYLFSGEYKQSFREYQGIQTENEVEMHVFVQYRSNSLKKNYQYIDARRAPASLDYRYP